MVLTNCTRREWREWLRRLTLATLSLYFDWIFRECQVDDYVTNWPNIDVSDSILYVIHSLIQLSEQSTLVKLQLPFSAAPKLTHSICSSSKPPLGAAASSWSQAAAAVAWPFGSLGRVVLGQGMSYWIWPKISLKYITSHCQQLYNPSTFAAILVLTDIFLIAPAHPGSAASRFAR